MICMYSSGKVETFDTEIDYPVFRIPMLVPRRVEWIKSEDAVPLMKEPVFYYLEFKYIGTVDDHRIYKEV